MSYTVRILPIAAQERRRIFDYIHNRSPQGAESWEAAYEAALTRLEKDPLIYGLAEESKHFDFHCGNFCLELAVGIPIGSYFG